jgi:3-methyladenine DNA glycosylase AlkC
MDLNNNDIKVGRPSLGFTKKVSITLPDEVWQIIEQLHDNKSAYFRELVAKDFKRDKHKSNLIQSIIQQQQDKGNLN